MATKLIREEVRGPSRADLDELTAKEKIFLLEYLCSEDMNGTRICREMGHKHPRRAAHQYLSKPTIKKALGRALAKRLAKFDPDKVVSALVFSFYFNPFRYFGVDPDTGDWTTDDPNSIPDEVGRLVKSIKVMEGPDGQPVYKVEFGPFGNEIAPMVLKHLGLDGVSKHEFSGKVTLDWSRLGQKQEEEDKVEAELERASHWNGLRIEQQKKEEEGIIDAEYTIKELIEGNGEDEDA